MRTESNWEERSGSFLQTVWNEGRDILINGVSKYLNFGSVSGSSGYGFRDNAGTMQVKNSGGSWSNFTSGGAGTGDMLVATYDPQGIEDDAFDTDNHTDGTTNHVFTALDDTKLAGIEASADVTDTTNVVSSLSGATLTGVTVGGTDKVIIQDTSDSDNIKTVTAQSIADLASGGVSSVNSKTGAVTLDPDDLDDTSTTNKFATAAEKTKLGYISVTQAVDLDTMESDTATNNAKTSNATHTGQVTGATTLTVDKTAITGQSAVTAVGTDYVLISDTSDSGNLKKALASDLGGGNNYFNNTYIDQSSGTSDTYGAVSGTLNGSNTTFTVSQSVYTTGTLKVWLNGQLQEQGSSGDWVETTPASGTFDFAVAPQSTDEITVEYQTATLSSDTVLTDAVIIDEDNMASDSDTKVPTQQSVKAYVDANSGSGITAVVDDTSPQLGGDLDLNGHVVTGLVIGTNVQAYDSNLTTWAGITPGTGVGTALAVNTGTDGAFVVKGGALGTPSGGTLTNATGLPIAGLVASTSTALGVGTVELGHASDTTISRVSAGKIAVEGVNVVTTSSTDTLTNKTLTSPTLTTPVLGTPSSGTLTNCTFPTLNQNTTGSAATLTTTRTIWGQNFNGSANVTGTLALGASSMTLTGSIGATGARATKVWATDIESTNAPTVGGTALPTASSTTTLTNKTLIASSNVLSENTTTTSSATPTPTGGSLKNFFSVTALATGATFAAPSGTPANWNTLVIRITDSGSGQTLAWDAIYQAMGFTLPTAIAAGKTGYLTAIYNSTASKWQCLSYNEEA